MKKITVNDPLLPVGDIVDQMLEKRPLPMGLAEFDIWADRIISGALLKADIISQKHALANMIVHECGTTESHKEDGYFIHRLRKNAANLIAIAKIDEYQKLAAEKAKQNEQVDLDKL